MVILLYVWPTKQYYEYYFSLNTKQANKHGLTLAMLAVLSW